jgi:hypothetical protein
VAQFAGIPGAAVKLSVEIQSGPDAAVDNHDHEGAKEPAQSGMFFIYRARQGVVLNPDGRCQKVLQGFEKVPVPAQAEIGRT